METSDTTNRAREREPVFQDENHLNIDDCMEEPSGEHSNMKMIMRSFGLLNLEKGQQLLELGPGNGAHLPEVMKQWYGISYTGVEVSETMNHDVGEHCRGINKVAVLMTDGHSLPFGCCSFDRVVSVNTGYFWENPIAYVKEIKRVLKKGVGTLCLSFIPEDFMAKRPFSRRGIEFYNLEKAKNLLTDSGFEIAQMFTESETIKSNSGEKIERERSFILAVC